MGGGGRRREGHCRPALGGGRKEGGKKEERKEEQKFAQEKRRGKGRVFLLRSLPQNDLPAGKGWNGELEQLLRMTERGRVWFEWRGELFLGGKGTGIRKVMLPGTMKCPSFSAPITPPISPVFFFVFIFPVLLFTRLWSLGPKPPKTTSKR